MPNSYSRDPWVRTFFNVETWQTGLNLLIIGHFVIPQPLYACLKGRTQYELSAWRLWLSSRRLQDVLSRLIVEVTPKGINILSMSIYRVFMGSRSSLGTIDDLLIHPGTRDLNPFPSWCHAPHQVLLILLHIDFILCPTL